LNIKITNTLLLPAILKQINLLANANENLSKFNIKPKIFSKEFETLIKLYDDIKKYCIDLDNFPAADHIDITATANEFSSKGTGILTKLREKVDIVEDLVADEFWPMASYQKLLNTF
jgi:glutamine synthetase